MRSIKIIAIIEVFVITAILILIPIFMGIGAIKPPSTQISNQLLAPNLVNNPILTTNPTPAEAMLSYSRSAQNVTANPIGIRFLDEIEQHILVLTNEERSKRGLITLEHDPMLQTTARAHSADMLERDFFDHVSPEGRTPHDRIAIIHRQLIGGTGENIWQIKGKGYDVNDALKIAERAMEGWMNSPGHRENILRESYTHLGVGGAVKEDTVKLTQNFASTQALFQQPLPLKVKRGDYLPLTTIPATQKYAPVKYGFWVSEKGVLAANPISIKQTQVAVEPGDYRLRLYFVTSRKKDSVSYLISSGPQVVVD
jgi:uncharacterized protein YkwD